MLYMLMSFGTSKYIYSHMQHLYFALRDKNETESSGFWPHKTGACLIEVHLHVQFTCIIGLGGDMKVLA